MTRSEFVKTMGRFEDNKSIRINGSIIIYTVNAFLNTCGEYVFHIKDMYSNTIFSMHYKDVFSIEFIPKF